MPFFSLCFIYAFIFFFCASLFAHCLAGFNCKYWLIWTISHDETLSLILSTRWPGFLFDGKIQGSALFSSSV